MKSMAELENLQTQYRRELKPAENDLKNLRAHGSPNDRDVAEAQGRCERARAGFVNVETEMHDLGDYAR